MPRVSFMTLGCKVNQFETETMEGLFLRAGYQIVPFGEAADVCVVNTCSVTALGEKKSRQIVRRARRENANAIIAVTGCYAQLSPEELAALDGVRLVVGTRDRARIVEMVERAAREDGVVFDVGDVMAAKDFEDIPLYGTPTRTRAFLKIQEEFGSFDRYIWSFTNGEVIDHHLKRMEDMPATSELSERVSKDLKKRGFRFVGPTIIYSYLQGIGIYNDHLENCDFR